MFLPMDLTHVYTFVSFRRGIRRPLIFHFIFHKKKKLLDIFFLYGPLHITYSLWMHTTHTHTHTLGTIICLKLGSLVFATHMCRFYSSSVDRRSDIVSSGGSVQQNRCHPHSYHSVAWRRLWIYDAAYHQVRSEAKRNWRRLRVDSTGCQWCSGRHGFERDSHAKGYFQKSVCRLLVYQWTYIFGQPKEVHVRHTA